MAPKKNFQPQRRGRRAQRKHHSAANNVVSPSSTSAGPAGTLSANRHGAATTLEAENHNTMHGEVQANKKTHGDMQYIYITRPYDQLVHKNDNLAMERWLDESVIEAPWHGIEGFFVCENQKMDNKGYDGTSRMDMDLEDGLGKEEGFSMGYLDTIAEK